MTKNTLVIGDTHIPFELPGYLKFCKRLHKRYECSSVVHIGDLIDNHAISYWEKSTRALGAKKEMDLADKHLAPWFKAFPRVYLCWGNHDRLVARKMQSAGMPERCSKTFREIWKLPKGWKDSFEWVLDDVLYKHGTGFSGRYAHVTAAERSRMNTVIGHTHASGGIEYLASSRDCIFGMNVSSGIDRKAYAFDYGKDFPRKPIIGAGIISHTKYGTNAHYIRMLMK